MARPSFDCITCDKYKAHRADTPEKGGTCRAHPPTPFVIMVGTQVTTHPLTHGRTQEPLIQQGATWPAVGKGDYCFEHPLARSMPLFGQGQGEFRNMRPPGEPPLVDIHRSRTLDREALGPEHGEPDPKAQG